MNRYTLLFAVMIAASLAIPSSQIGQRTPSEINQEKTVGINPASNRNLQGAEVFINGFLHPSALNRPRKTVTSKQSKLPGLSHTQVLFATLPHPLETHLAAEFDHNVDAIQDGLQDSGFVFDSAWIPWTAHSPREIYADDQQEKKAKGDEDKLPGILLFRKAGAMNDAYEYGLVVFLITEKPTQGISLEQVVSSEQIMKDEKLHFTRPISILGPTFSGSFPSLVRLVKEVARNGDNVTDFLIRSGGATVGDYANTAASQMATNGATVDLGSAQYDGRIWIKTAVDTLNKMGIKESEIAVLSESESVFGATVLNDRANELKTTQQSIGQIYFPRDISSLRADYQKQGLFDLYSAEEPWRRSLTLKSEETSEGDTARSFGGPDTDAAKESILIGISELIRVNGIRAVLVSATNEEDRYFLNQFIHARNSGVRVVVIGATRLFMRGSTAQFRGDLVVDSFPMLPRIHDWTAQSACQGSPKNFVARTFPDQSSQGTYFATLDLMMQPECRSTGDQQASFDTYPWVPEYSAPHWVNNQSPSPLRPPIYVVALGGASTWPLAEELAEPWTENDTSCVKCAKPTDCAKCKWRVNMPFTLYAYGSAHGLAQTPFGPNSSPQIHAASSWVALFTILIALGVGYCSCFWYADPTKHSACASFSPMPDWRYWFCKVILPGVLFSGAFQVMALSIDIPNATSFGAFGWWFGAEALTIAFPLAISLSALWQAFRNQCNSEAINAAFLPVKLWLVACFVPIALSVLTVVGLHYGQISDPSSVLNTYREMHWESGLSLIPTALIFLLAMLVWSHQAGQGLAILEVAPPLPVVNDNGKITVARSEYMAGLGRPLTSADGTIGLWVIWSSAVAVLFIILFGFQYFREITTLEAHSVTVAFLCVGCVIAGLILLDLLQFVWLWNRLKGVLRSLSRKSFRRSFVPVRDFTWRALWSFSGVSMRDRRRIEALQTDLVIKLVQTHGFGSLGNAARELCAMRDTYNKVPLEIGPKQYKVDREIFRKTMTGAGQEVYAWIKDLPDVGTNSHATFLKEQITICQCKDSEDRFAEDRAEVAQLEPKQRDAEKFVCLLYIGFIMTIVARLHCLLISVAAMFSLAALGVAIYPFAPVAPLVCAGLCLLGLIAFSYYEVFSGLDTDPVMARIVNGDDRKLQWSFYGKFAESMAFPLLTLASTLLPGGASRLLDLVKVLFNHGQ